MSINATLIIQLIVFFIGAWVTMKYIWPPLVQSLEQRRQKVAEGLAAAERGAAALKEASARTDEELRAARQQAQAIIAAANQQAAQIIEQAKASAAAEAERIVASGHAEVQRQIAQAKDALRKEVADLAVLGAARILKREISPAAHADVLNDLAARI